MIIWYLSIKRKKDQMKINVAGSTEFLDTYKSAKSLIKAMEKESTALLETGAHVWENDKVKIGIHSSSEPVEIGGWDKKDWQKKNL